MGAELKVLGTSWLRVRSGLGDFTGYGCWGGGGFRV